MKTSEKMRKAGFPYDMFAPEVAQLEANNAELLKACKVALEALGILSFGDYDLARTFLRQAIRKVEKQIR